jgi:hypothetical protein
MQYDHTHTCLIWTCVIQVAVDNLLEGLVDAGIEAVRVGQPVKVRESLRGATLDARLVDHPLQVRGGGGGGGGSVGGPRVALVYRGTVQAGEGSGRHVVVASASQPWLPDVSGLGGACPLSWPTIRSLCAICCRCHCLRTSSPSQPPTPTSG